MKKRMLFVPIFALLLSLGSCQLGKSETVIVNPDQEAINIQLQQGDQLYQNKAYLEAREAYTTILALDAIYLEAYICRAKVNIKLQELLPAEEDLLQAKTLLTAEHAASYHEVQAEYQLEKRNYHEALQALDTAMTLEPSTHRSAMKGNIYYRLHDHVKAKEHLLRASQDETAAERPTYYYLLSELAVYEGAYQEATTYLEALKQMEPDNSRYPAMQSYIFMVESEAEGRTHSEKTTLLTQAAEQMLEAKTKDPKMEDAITTHYLGLSHYRLGEMEAALKYYDQAILLDPHYAVFYNNRALVFYGAGDNIGAHKDLSTAIALDTLEPEFYFGRAYVSLTLEQEDAAIGDFSQAVKLDKTYMDRVPEDMKDKLPKTEETKKIESGRVLRFAQFY